jgi:hypothetical protein
MVDKVCHINAFKPTKNEFSITCKSRDEEFRISFGNEQRK